MTAQEQKTEFFSSINLSLSFQKKKEEKDGILRCAKYAFSPNQLGYCGPNKNQDLFEYCQTQTVDAGLNNILKKFQTLYPYLSFIAKENRIKDEFNQAVVDAYWLGNDLLANVKLNHFYQHLLDGQQLKKKLSKRLLNLVFGNFKRGVTCHHNFHVFNIWQRTGHLAIPHTLATMDKCRISWAKILRVLSNSYEVAFRPLAVGPISDKLTLAPPLKKIVTKGFVSNAQINDWISLHWDWPCEKLSRTQLANLKKYTKQMLFLTH